MSACSNSEAVPHSRSAASHDRGALLGRVLLLRIKNLGPNEILANSAPRSRVKGIAAIVSHDEVLARWNRYRAPRVGRAPAVGQAISFNHVLLIKPTTVNRDLPVSHSDSLAWQTDDSQHKTLRRIAGILEPDNVASLKSTERWRRNGALPILQGRCHCLADDVNSARASSKTHQNKSQSEPTLRSSPDACHANHPCLLDAKIVGPTSLAVDRFRAFAAGEQRRLRDCRARGMASRERAVGRRVTAQSDKCARGGSHRLAAEEAPRRVCVPQAAFEGD